jgi:hypothetical protein
MTITPSNPDFAHNTSTNPNEWGRQLTVISSPSTRFYKLFFPVLWFGIIGTVGLGMLLSGAARVTWLVVVGPTVMALVGYVVFKRFIWLLADEVRDGGDHLIVRFGDDEDTIKLSNIMNVNASINTIPPQVTLRLAEPCRFGNEVSFTPKRKTLSFNLFAKNEIVEDLIVRVDQARTQRVMRRSAQRAS